MNYFVKTFGCQMNAHDSQTAAGLLEEMGYLPVDTMQDADVILFNTCCIRDLAEKKAYAAIGAAHGLKKLNRKKIIGVFGCMSQQESAQQELRRRFPLIDFVFGTNHLHELPTMIEKAKVGQQRYLREIGNAAEDFSIRPKHSAPPLAFTNIMQGCNNFCSYCIVPYVRGREISRPMPLILDEVQTLIQQGYREVTLLGQNVNSYGNDTKQTSFAELLEKINQTGIERIRFMTSHPKDLSDRLIEAMASLPHVCKQIHLPAQSGSDRILAAMNRRYTSEHYFTLIEKLRKAMPHVGITTDIIVGFPGETEQEFEDTLALMRSARFHSAFTFAYSPRVGTPAASMPDQLSKECKSERLARLIDLQKQITAEIYNSMVGNTYTVLAESVSRRNSAHLTGKTDDGTTVNFAGDAAQIGSIFPVKILRANTNTLFGAVEGEEQA